MTTPDVTRPIDALPAPVICCERSGDWAMAWRQTADRESVLLPIVETRSLPEALETLVEQPTALLLVELSADNLDGVAELLRTMDRRFPQARAVVVAARNLRACGPLVRELGAVDFVTSPRRLGALVRGAGRDAELHAAERPARHADQTTTDRIWNLLPWSE